MIAALFSNCKPPGSGPASAPISFLEDPVALGLVGASFCALLRPQESFALLGEAGNWGAPDALPMVHGRRVQDWLKDLMIFANLLLKPSLSQ